MAWSRSRDVKHLNDYFRAGPRRSDDGVEGVIECRRPESSGISHEKGESMRGVISPSHRGGGSVGLPGKFFKNWIA